MGCGAVADECPAINVKDVEVVFFIQTVQGETYCCYKPSKLPVLLVTIHGLGGTRNSVFFRDLPLHTECATLRFDLAGHGRSGGDFSLAMGPQICEIQEVLRNELFKSYSKRIYIGHSKGANLAICVANPGETVVAIAGRFYLDRFPRAMCSERDKDAIMEGNIVIKSFGGRELEISKDLIDELSSYDFAEILGQKRLNLVVIAGKKDFIANKYEEKGFEPFCSNGIHWVSSGHFGFRYDIIRKVCGGFWETRQ